MSISLKVDTEKYTANKLPKDQQAHMRRLQGLIDVYEADTRQSGRLSCKQDVEHILLEALGKKARPKRTSASSFFVFFAQYLDDVDKGLILNSGKNYSSSYIKTAGVVARMLQKFKISQVPVNKVSEEDLRVFAAELTAMGYAKNSVATYMDPVISFLQNGRRLGRHNGSLLDMRSFRVNREDIDHGVYLTEEEQTIIAALDMDGQRAVWRDAFLLGCCVGMRHSDLSRLTPTHRRGDVVNINTTKTSTPIWVPLSSTAREIWDRHQGIFQIPGLTPFMLFAKDLGELADFNGDVLFGRTEGGKRVERWVPKFELMGTHTMRRSFATNAYKANVPVPSIMKVTGHRSTINFLKYIRLSDEEHAKMLIEHPHFKK